MPEAIHDPESGNTVHVGTTGNLHVTLVGNSETVNNYSGDITVTGGSGTVDASVSGRPILIIIKGPNTTATFSITINDGDSAGVADLDTFKAVSRSNGQAISRYEGKGLGISDTTLTITISGASDDGAYKYIVRSI